jgi:hypothetical protein
MLQISETNLGQRIAEKPGLLNGITVDEAPKFGGKLLLVDNQNGEHVIFAMELLSTISVGEVLLANGNMYFDTLAVKEIPIGSKFTIDIASYVVNLTKEPEQEATHATE